MPEAEGQRFGKYLLLDRIAAGGMAEIFRARYLAAAGITKPVVIKRILPHYAGNKAFVGMFVNEARIAVSLAHGNIAQVFDFGEVDGEYYLAMEYVHGQPLSRLIRRVAELKLTVPIPVAVAIAADIASGLHYAHTRKDEKGRGLGIIHRDVSPQNVMLSYEGQVKLVDFGIAKMVAAGQRNDQESSALKGKYVYFSPEQARSQAVDHRTDIFATGIVLYEMLTGRRPFEGKMMDVLTLIGRGEFRRPRAVNPQIPHELEQILLKALARDRDARYATALELHDALTRQLHASAPRFSAGLVGQFMQYVFQAELDREGIQVKLPPDLMSQLSIITEERVTQPEMEATPPPEEASEPEPEVDPSDEPTNTARAPTMETAATLEPDETAPWKKQLAVALVAVLVAIGGLALWLKASGPRTFALQITSDPRGASVFIDGSDTGRNSPTLIEGLVADRPHEVALLVPGHRPYHGKTPVVREGTSTLRIDAMLPKEELPPPEEVKAPPPPPVVEAKAVVPAKDDSDKPHLAVAKWPDAEVLLEPKLHALDLASSRAAHVRLDPRRVYRLTVEGSVVLGSGPVRHTTRSVLFAGERIPKAATAKSYGQLLPGKPTIVTGLKTLYGFLIDANPSQNGGALRIRIYDVKSRRTAFLGVDAVKNAIEPDYGSFAKIEGLDPKSGYELSLTGIVDLGLEGGTSRKALYYRSVTEDLKAGAADLSQGAIEVGQKVRIDGAREVWVFLPDGDQKDDVGSFTATVTGRGAAVVHR